MSSADASDWPPGTHFYTRISEHDHAGWIYIITLISLCYMVIVFAVRFVVKYGKYGNDDWTLLAATVVAIAQHMTVLAGLTAGMGKSSSLMSFEQLQIVERYAAAHSFLFIIAQCFSKLSTALLTKRLFQNGRNANFYVCWGLLGVSIFYGLWSILALAAACANPASPIPISSHEQCHGRVLRWQLVTALDIATEAILSVVPPLLLLGVQIKRSAQVLVMVVFAVRIADVAFSYLNLRSFMLANTSSTDPGLALVQPIMWTQTELLWSIIAASVPCLKTFIRPFDKIDEETYRSTNYRMYGTGRSAGRSWRDPVDKDGAIALDDFRGHKRGLVGQDEDDGAAMRLDKPTHNVTITTAGVDNSSEEDHRRSWGSQERIIKTHTEWEVRTEPYSKDAYTVE